MKKRFLSLFLAVLMLATAFSVSAMPVAAEESEETRLVNAGYVWYRLNRDYFTYNYTDYKAYLNFNGSETVSMKLQKPIFVSNGNVVRDEELNERLAVMYYATYLYDFSYSDASLQRIYEELIPAWENIALNVTTAEIIQSIIDVSSDTLGTFLADISVGEDPVTAIAKAVAEATVDEIESLLLDITNYLDGYMFLLYCNTLDDMKDEKELMNNISGDSLDTYQKCLNYKNLCEDFERSGHAMNTLTKNIAEQTGKGGVEGVIDVLYDAVTDIEKSFIGELGDKMKLPKNKLEEYASYLAKNKGEDIVQLAYIAKEIKEGGFLAYISDLKKIQKICDSADNYFSTLNTVITAYNSLPTSYDVFIDLQKANLKICLAQVVDKLSESKINSYREDIYQKALNLAGMSSFDGYCGECVGRQLQAIGIITERITENGCDTYSRYASMTETSGGYTVNKFPASSYSMENCLNRLDVIDDSKYTFACINFHLGYEGNSYGHTLLVYAVIDGTVYYNECTNTNTGTVYGKRSISDFCRHYSQNGYQYEGMIYFSKSVESPHGPTTDEEFDDYYLSGKLVDNVTWMLNTENGVLSIFGDGAMSNSQYPWYDKKSSIKSVVIANGVTSIGREAFSGCSNLASVIIPDSVTSIGSEAFYSCNGLTSVTIGNGVKSIGDYAFHGCSGLTSVTIGNSVTSIGEYAFGYCSGLTSITIPDSVTSIGKSAFSGCSGLTSVTIGNGVKSIGDSAFSGCNGLKKVNITDLKSWCNIHFFDATSSYNTHSASVGHSQSNPLSYAQHLYLNDREIKDLVIPEGVTSIRSVAFFGCSGLTSVTIGNSVTSVGIDAFANCDGLTSVTIGNSVTRIGTDAFYDCDGITSVMIGNGVTNIGDYAFYDCDGITSVMIGNGVTSIGREAFRDCSNLASVIIPDSVTSIGEYAFYGCGLETIYYTGSEDDWKKISIGSGAENATIIYNHVCTHKYSDNCDTTCNICGETREITHQYQLLNDENEHWYECSVCHNKKDICKHIFANNICKVCGHERIIDENAPQIYVESIKSIAGEQFTVAVKIKNNPGFNVLELTPVYSSGLTLVSVTNNVENSLFTKGNQYVWALGSDYEGENLLTFTFETSEELAAGDYSVGFEFRKCENWNKQSVAFTVISGNIEIIDFIYGDADGNGTVDLSDVNCLMRYIAYYDYATDTSSEIVCYGADANGDGRIDLSDVNKLMRYIAYYDYSTETSTEILGEI